MCIISDSSDLRFSITKNRTTTNSSGLHSKHVHTGAVHLPEATKLSPSGSLLQKKINIDFPKWEEKLLSPTWIIRLCTPTTLTSHTVTSEAQEDHFYILRGNKKLFCCVGRSVECFWWQHVKQHEVFCVVQRILQRKYKLSSL